MVSEEGQEWVSPLGGHQVAKGKGRAGLRSIVGNNKQRILGPERYLYEVGKSPTHDLYTPHILVAKKKTTTKTTTNMILGLYQVFLGGYQ